MAAATLVGAQSDAMRAAASNEAGAMTGFMGMGMAQNAGGMNAQNLFAMGQQNQQSQQSQQGQQTPPADGWACSCGTSNTGKFCANCGNSKPAPAGSWTCSCGATNTGKFCAECGNQKPSGTLKCVNCGWESEDPSNTPKFCPECGNKF